MKREFLESLIKEINSDIEVKEFVDKIMEEHGKDITKHKKEVTDAQLALKTYKDEKDPIIADYEKLKETTLTDSEKLQKALESANAKELEMQKRFNKLEIEKLFVDAKMPGYEKFIDNIISDDLESSKITATGMIDAFNIQQQIISDLKLDGTPRPAPTDPTKGTTGIGELQATRLNSRFSK